ncbi:type II toxin-antitoxin system PemK/MazF family toxin [Williamsia sp. CHRR-6]|uniref:type II toxin-antitoxin system PemK/MazF family toxin n=1 Tax=Williamsia sp. CHRR-6 TaxID=2835871 RepID=UPI001BD9AF90|nr:type II toxin-antitoxin system PemK/MazF family toxin [Williamsia sp. CHRR-6]MBT0565405.1 type II toxin-antitoxin system PemK/MazF family toxin [Williamsia sp. CHRR-6]
MASWTNTALRLARQYGPRLFAELKRSGALDKGREAITARMGSAAASQAPAPGRPPGRPVTESARPTADRARRIEYSPTLDGDADPGEIVWTWVTFEEDASQGKDRPVLVVGREGDHLLGLMLSSQAHRADDPDWTEIGTGSWDGGHKVSYLRLNRVLDVPEAGIRREGAILDRNRFDAVATRLRSDYGWS